MPVRHQERAEKRREGRSGNWRASGIWQARTPCVFSSPRGEPGAKLHLVQTSNRRFRDDEFLIPRELTAGRAAIRVRVKFTPVETPLYPGYPLAGAAWNEMRYTAYSFVIP